MPFRQRQKDLQIWGVHNVACRGYGNVPCQILFWMDFFVIIDHFKGDVKRNVNNNDILLIVTFTTIQIYDCDEMGQIKQATSYIL